jgi:hypothetical protein
MLSEENKKCIIIILGVIIIIITINSLATIEGMENVNNSESNKDDDFNIIRPINRTFNNITNAFRNLI